MLGVKIDYNKRIYGFDLLRALAIFFVVHGHGKHLLRGTVLEGFPWFYLPHGVDIFFVLSGFLIGYSFIVNSIKSGNKLASKKVINFWERSIFRILPNYYLILAVNYVLVNKGIINGNTEQFGLIRFATFTQNLYYPFYDFFWESWSLAVQEWFYLLFPLFLYFLTKIRRVKSSVLIISITFIIISIVYRLSIGQRNFDSFWWDVYYRKVVASRIDTIFFGVLAAWVRYYYPKIWNRFAVHSFIAGLIIFIATVNIPRNPNGFYSKVIFLSLSTISIALWFPLIDRLKDHKSVVGKVVSVISFLSYAMYLFNLMLIQIIDHNFPDFLSSQATLKYVLYWCATLILSYLLYVLYENPISKFGNRALHTTKMMYKNMRSKEA